MRRALGVFVLVIGVLAILSSAVLTAHAQIDENRAKNSAARTTVTLNRLIKDSGLSDDTSSDGSESDVYAEAYGETNDEPSGGTARPAPPPPVKLDGRTYVGILRIPALSLELPISDNYSEALLKDSPCRYSGDLSGGMTIGAHNYNAHFGNIVNLAYGAEVIITDSKGAEHKYIVRLIEILPEEDIDGKINSPYDLTLFTCTKNRVERVAVRCEKISTVAPNVTVAAPVSAISAPKAPKFRLNYRNETVKVKSGFFYSLDGGDNFHEVTEGRGTSLDVSENITQGVTIQIYRAAGKKRAASLVQTIVPIPRAELESGALDTQNGRVRSDKRYEAYNPVTGKWGRLPKISGDAEIDIRLKNSTRSVDGIITGTAASLPGKLVVTFGEFKPRRTGVTSAEINPRAVTDGNVGAPDVNVTIIGRHAYFSTDSHIIADGVNYTSNSMLYEQARRVSENIITFTPSARIQPVVVGPSVMYRRGITLREAVFAAEEQGYEVYGGVNASFFEVGSRTPIGLQIRDGVLTAMNPQKLPAVGFFADGSVMVGEPDVTVSVSSRGGSVEVDRLNKIREEDLIFLYTPDFDENTRITQDGVQVVLKVSGSLSIGSTVTGTVSRILHGNTPHTVAADEMVLSASTQREIDALAFLTVNSSVALTVSCSDGKWNEVVYAAGGLNRLVVDGESQSHTGSERAPRTAIGVTAEGEVILYTVDGRQSDHSVGLTLGELADRMLELGCETAFNLDGGGSTAMFIRLPGEDTASLVNRPSDGSLRRCADFILLCG
jgi:sortase (surface protein transpeptidase)